MTTIDDLLNAAAMVRDEDQEQENTAFRVGTLLVNVIQYLSTRIAREDANAAISDALADFFVEGALKESALPPDFMSSLSDWAEGLAGIESTTQLLKLIHSRIILLDSMGSTLDGLDYTPVAGDLVWRTGYVWKYNGSTYEDGGLRPQPHVVYVNKHTSKMYMWNGDSMEEVGNHYDDKIQISKMDQTAVSDIPVGKLHYIPSQSKLVYRISASKTHSWTPRADLIYIDISNNTLYRWQGTSFQKISSDTKPVNDLTTGGEDKALSAEMGKRMKAKIEEAYQRVQTLYGLLGNIAFWEGKPDASTILPALDWGNPKHTVTLALNLTNAVVKNNDSVVNNGASILVEEGGTLTFIVEPASGYTLTSVTSSTTGASVTDLGNGTYSVAITMGQNNLTLNISATAVARHSINVSVNKVTQPMTFVAGKRNYSSENMAIAADTTTGVEVSGPTSVIHGASFEGTVIPSESHDLFSVAVSMGGTDITATAYNALTRVINISEVTADVLVSIVVAEAENGTFTGVSFMPQKIVGVSNPTVGLLIGDAEWCCATDYFRIPNDATNMKWDFGVSKTAEGDDSNCHRGLIMYDDGLTPTGYWSCYVAGTASGRTVTIRDTDKGKLVRASFYRSGLADAKVSISTDNGSTWSVVWNGMEHVVND